VSGRSSFVVEDQSRAIAVLERTLKPDRRIETHGALVFLAGDRAYKMKRAVRFPYMDFSTVDLRHAMCAAEIDINARLAPEIYLGVEAVHEDGRQEAPVIDWLVVMRRFDDARLFDRLAERDALTGELMAALGARVASFHAGLLPVRAEFGTPESYEHSIAADVRQMREHGTRLLPEVSEALAEAMPRSLAPYLDLVARRRADGWIRRCHGDLHLRNIVLLEGKPVPFDAIEFSPRIATIDVLYDLAFTLMDLCHRGLRGLANRLLNEWLWRMPGDHEEGLALLPMFLGRRAAIRAYVDAANAAIHDTIDEKARAYQRTALDLLQPAPPVLRAIGGLSGSGKTTLALEEAPALGRSPGAVVVRSDVERKRLAGIALEERMPAGSYTPQASARTYAVMLERAERLLRAGQSVVLDAVFARPEEREAAEALGKRLAVPFRGLWLDIPKEVAQARVAGRQGDASDATPAVVERQFGFALGEITWERRRSGG
jgi:aminoglycoside phosphotransferase family enzyme/predicted kinase